MSEQIAQASRGRYEADPSHTSVLFRIKHLGLSWYTGRFVRVAATLDFDPDDVAQMRLDARIELKSIQMNYLGTDKDWDKELAESDQFLDAARHPIARFVSYRIQRTGDETADVQGTLSLRGFDRPFTLATTYNGSIPDRQTGRPRIGFSAQGTLKRSQHGLTFGLGPAMPDDVQVIVEAEFLEDDYGAAA